MEKANNSQRITYNPKPKNTSPSGLPDPIFNPISWGGQGALQNVPTIRANSQTKQPTTIYIPKTPKVPSSQQQSTEEPKKPVTNNYSVYDILSNPVKMSIAFSDWINSIVYSKLYGNNNNSNFSNPLTGRLFDVMNTRRQPTTGMYGDPLQFGKWGSGTNPFDAGYVTGNFGQTPVTLADQSGGKNGSNYWGGYGSGSGGGSVSYNPWNWFFSLLNWRI